MYHDDHNPPHIHIEYQGHEAFMDIQSAKIYKGNIPKKATKIVEEWVIEHKDELMKNWQKAINLEPLEKIKGADND